MKKYILTLILLLVSWIVSTPVFAVSEAEAADEEHIEIGNKAERDETLQEIGHIAPEDYRFKVGDTIIISKDVTTYLTGEQISNWVYYVRHRIGQVGGKRFPEGILLEGINSWVEPYHSLLLLGSVVENDTAHVREHHDRPKIHERLQELDNLPMEEKEAIAKMAERHNVTSMVIEAREHRVKDSLEVIMREREQRLLDSIAAERAALLALQAEQARRDSIAAAEQAREQERLDSIANLRKQFNRVGLGLRGGVASMMQKTLPEANGKWNAGFDVLLDAQYAHYWQNGDKPAMGILTGLSVGYTRNGVTANGNRTFDITDEDGDKVRYTITGASATENDGSVVIEIPVLFSTIIKDNWFVNAGPRFAIPVFSHYKQNMTETHIDSWNMTKNVHVPDELVTGKVTKDMLEKNAATQLSRVNIMLTAEGGYEYKFASGQILSAGVYANYSVFSLYPNDPTGKELVGIVPPSGEAQAVVTVSPTTQAFVPKNGLGFFDCGVKVIYHFKVW